MFKFIFSKLRRKQPPSNLFIRFCIKKYSFLYKSIIGLNRSIHQKTNWEILKMENVEALTSPEEENPYYPCVSARGFCFMNGIDIDGVALKIR